MEGHRFIRPSLLRRPASVQNAFSPGPSPVRIPQLAAIHIAALRPAPSQEHQFHLRPRKQQALSTLGIAPTSLLPRLVPTSELSRCILHLSGPNIYRHWHCFGLSLAGNSVQNRKAGVAVAIACYRARLPNRSRAARGLLRPTRDSSLSVTDTPTAHRGSTRPLSAFGAGARVPTAKHQHHFVHWTAHLHRCRAVAQASARPDAL